MFSTGTSSAAMQQVQRGGDAVDHVIGNAFHTQRFEVGGDRDAARDRNSTGVPSPMRSASSTHADAAIDEALPLPGQSHDDVGGPVNG
jgi:hypothetical protein